MSTKGECEPWTGQKLQPLQKPHSASVWGRNWSPQARSVRVQSLTLLTLSCQGITETTTRSLSPSKKKEEGEATKGMSRAHLNRQPFAPKSAVYHLGYLGIDECEGKKIHWILQLTATECSILGQEKKVWCAWINLNIYKFSFFRLSNNLCCHWCGSLRSPSYPNPLKNGKRDPKSLTRIAQHSISCGSACLMQVWPSPFWGAHRTVL